MCFTYRCCEHTSPNGSTAQLLRFLGWKTGGEPLSIRGFCFSVLVLRSSHKTQGRYSQWRQETSQLERDLVTFSRTPLSLSCSLNIYLSWWFLFGCRSVQIVAAPNWFQIDLFGLGIETAQVEWSLWTWMVQRVGSNYLQYLKELGGFSLLPRLCAFPI